MKNTNYLSMMLLISVTLGTSAWAQSNNAARRGWGGSTDRHYGGGQNQGISRMGTPVFNTGCGQAYSQPGQQALLDACVRGGAAGMQTAQRYASQQGRNDGFRTGYAWGARYAIDNTRTDPSQMAAGQAALNTRDSPDMIQKLALADQAGATAGAQVGAPNGDQEAVARFHNAIDTGVMPSQNISTDDFARYNPQYSSQFSDPYAQTIGRVYNEADILNNQRIDYGNVTFYNNGYDTDIYGNAPQFRPGDFYRQDGRYGFDRNESLSGRRAFEIFLNKGGFDRSGYSSLGNVQIITGYTNPAPAPSAPVATPAPTPTPAPTNPGNNGGGPQGGNHGQGGNGGGGGQGGGHNGGGQAGGNNGGGQHGPGTGGPTGPTAPTTPTTPTAPTGSVGPQPIYTNYDLKQIYQQAFIQSYENIAPFYYNNSYNDLLDDGTNAGAYVGTQVGQRLAFQTGLVTAYTSQFRQRENNAFYFGTPSLPGYQAAFKNAFDAEYLNYATHPQIGVDSFSIAGVRDDGIVEPGEGITASFIVRNYGGVDATLPITLGGDVSGAKATVIVAPKLKTLRQNGSLTANISSNVASQSNANVVLNIGDKRIPLSQYVTRQVTSGAANYSADYAHGTISVSLPIKNVSRVNSYDTVKVIVTDSLGRTQTLPIGFLAGGQVWSTPVNLTGFDQLDMIDGKITVQMQALLGSVSVGSATVIVSTNDRLNLIASAFEVIAQGTDEALKTKIVNRIYSDVKDEAVNARVSEYNNIDSLINALVSAKSSHLQTATTIAAYSKLADTLAPIVKQMRGARIGIFGGRSVNQKFLEKQLNALRN